MTWPSGLDFIGQGALWHFLDELFVAFAIGLAGRNRDGLVLADGHAVDGAVESRYDLPAAKGKFQWVSSR